jgi:hypothetical protein
MRQTRNQKPETRNQKWRLSGAFLENQKPEIRNQKSWPSEAFLVSDFWFLVSRPEVSHA